jgi:prevent-host-death family protein
METVGAFEAKTQLSALLERVARGERITITRRGVPVAMLVPVSQGLERDPAQAAARIRELRKGNFLGDLSVRELIDEGRR